jgi:hypothetical protein
LKKQEIFYQNLLETELGKLSFPVGGVLIGALICILSLLIIKDEDLISAVFVLFSIGGFLILHSFNSHNKAKKKINENFEESKHKAIEVLRGCIAETVDYRKEHSIEDSNAEKVRQLITSITPESFSSVSKETARNII